METVSFKVAKAIKNAGYPQGQEEYAYRSNGDIYIFEDMFDHIPDYCCDAPTYMEVWLWLWREGGFHIYVNGLNFDIYTKDRTMHGEAANNDPEEAIIAAIEYLVENNLIK